MIEKITEDKYLYQGRIVDLAFLQAKAAELQELIAANEAAIKEITFIELIPQIEGNEQYLEAAELYNLKMEEEKEYLNLQKNDLSSELNNIKSVIN